jgi:hypothetical protein
MFKCPEPNLQGKDIEQHFTVGFAAVLKGFPLLSDVCLQPACFDRGIDK